MNHFPSSVLRASSPQGEGFPLLDETKDSATPGQTLRAEGQEGRIWELLLRRPNLDSGLLSKCCHSARSRRRSRRIHPPGKDPLPRGEGGPLPEAEEEPETTFFPIGKQP